MSAYSKKKIESIILFVGICFILIIPLSCELNNFSKEANAHTYDENYTMMNNIIFKFSLTDNAQYNPQLEFAENESKYILCRWLIPNKDFYYQNERNKVLANLLVFDFNGSVVNATEKDGKTLIKKFISLFPETSYRQKWKKFIKDAEGWGFSIDERYGVRLNENRTTNEWDIEFWEFTKETKLLWKKEKITKLCLRPIVKFINYDSKKSILIAFNVGRAFILSQDSGKLLDSFGYGPEDTIEVLKDRAKKTRIRCPEGIEFCDLDFSSNTLSFNTTKMLLAAGDGHSQRVRIVKIDKSHDMIFELNTDSNPFNPKGGHWSVRTVKFSKNGNYLLVEYWFQGRLTNKVFEPTVIYETENWQACWIENSTDIREVTISPDGKMIAFIKDNTLEVRKFVPNSKVIVSCFQ